MRIPNSSPAEPSRCVLRSQTVADAVRNGHQQLISRAVSDTVVNGLEVVQVQEEHGGGAGSIASGKGMLPAIGEEHPVREPRERVVGRLVLQLLFECTQLCK